MLVCVINVIFLLCERSGKSDNAVIFGYTCDKLYHKIARKLFFDDNAVVVNCLILIDEVCFPELTSLHVERPLNQSLYCLLQLSSNSLVVVEEVGAYFRISAKSHKSDFFVLLHMIIAELRGYINATILSSLFYIN